MSSLFLSTTYIHGIPIPPSTFQYIRSHPSIDAFPSLRLSHHYPVPNTEYDLSGDISEMLTGESNELTTTNDHDADSLSYVSSVDASNQILDFYLDPSPSQPLSRELSLLLLRKQNGQKEETELQQQQQRQEQEIQEKRSPSSIISTSTSLPTQFDLHSAVAAGTYADRSDANNVTSLSQLSESIRLSPSLKILVERHPLMRTWLLILLQKVMEERPPPSIFKYGRRRKKQLNIINI